MIIMHSLSASPFLPPFPFHSLFAFPEARFLSCYEVWGLFIYRHLGPRPTQFFWQLQLINLGLSSIALSNYIHHNLAYSSQSTPLPLIVTIRISIADLIAGARGISSGEPLRLGTFGCEKIVLIFTVKSMLKFENI